MGMSLKLTQHPQCDKCEPLNPLPRKQSI